jgi:hypothetical protein
MMAALLACGLGNGSTLFFQSQVRFISVFGTRAVILSGSLSPQLVLTKHPTFGTVIHS